MLVRNRLRELGVFQEHGLKDLIELFARFEWSASGGIRRVVDDPTDEPHLVGQLALLSQKDGRRTIGRSRLCRLGHLRLGGVTHDDEVAGGSDDEDEGRCSGAKRASGS